MTDQALPAPLTPADADLQDFPFMPLHVARLRDSDLAAEEEPEACWYALLLWSASWHQIPAGSLPTSDPVLMRMIGLGRGDGATWERHRNAALRGFVHCSDGRLYHPVVAEQVNSAWLEKQAYRTRKAVRKEIAQQAANARWSKSTPEADADADTMHDASTSDASCIGHAMLKERGTGTGIGTGTGNIIVEEEREREASEQDGPAVAKPPAAIGDVGTGLSADLARIVDAAGIGNLDPSRREWANALTRLKGWYAKGYEVERDILPAVERTLLRLPVDETIGSIQKIERELFGAKARARVTPPAVATPQPLAFEKPGEDARLIEWRTAAAVTIGAATYRNLLDGAELRTTEEELIITVADPIAEMQLSQNHLFRLEGLATKIIGCRLVRIIVRGNAG